ncbi:NAD(P)-dependent oxidoreductase [Mesorhizobium sp. INR15]|uniref:NAD(P)-dependent oxidoreductase n=1 Tax=Mesorhizobium sp. INR15 TaxID=2654248 RepID=UPI00189670F9|nr:NAD(P)-dependent oxidoreductase [Mesorhizobium sp. INR15]QPC92622.1 NAD-binding protein [Mesorhizobium sp. INR15]
MAQAPRIGFVGLGSMGSAMALNLVKARPLTVWNRSVEKTMPLQQAGASVPENLDELFASTEVVILMLADDQAIDSVLDRSGPKFTTRVANHVIVHMGTTSPRYSLELDKEITAAGGSYVEAPVSGSRKPAEAGQLIAMVAGQPSAISGLEPILASMCKTSIVCGAVPKALLMKLAVNTFLLATVTGLSEAIHFAKQSELDLDQLVEILAAGQMASDISRLKAPKLVKRDFSPHAAIADVLKNGNLISEAARQGGIALPLLDICRDLYEETLALGHGKLDMIAVVQAIEARTAAEQSLA